MATKLSEMICVFCRKNYSSRNGEHVPPLWFLEPFGLSEGPYRIEDAGTSRPNRDGDDWAIESIPKLKLPACEECNGELGRRFEQPVKEIVRELRKGRVQLCAPDSSTFGIWLLKTWLEQANPEARHSAPGGFGEPWDLSNVSDDLYSWMVSKSRPPDGLHVWLSRLGHRQEPGDPARRFVLPIGTKMFQCAWSFHAAGLLDVTLMYNATQPLTNPLEAEGRALRLWPITASDERDLGPLPYVGRADLAWLASSGA